jgi:tagatose-1,6-bisphosphate aldolase non-catalytic subunit AgaZ/GatZ
LNQVDRDGGYTGWTPADFTAALRSAAARAQWEGPLYACLDHGGPWLKDSHTTSGLTFEETFAEVKASITACLAAGYELLHVDPTVDRRLPPGVPPAVEDVVSRTVALMAHAENERQRMGLPPVVYEVGTEEVHGGLVDFDRFQGYLGLLKEKLVDAGLAHAWPGFIVAQVGTDLHTTSFDRAVAKRVVDLAAGYGSLVKGHYTDWVDCPEAYPLVGMGGANVGPEFTAAEYLALRELAMKEKALVFPALDGRGSLGLRLDGLAQEGLSDFMAVLTHAVVASGRWKKWLLPDEIGLDFSRLRADRQEWLAQTGARYVWTEASVVAARENLYRHLQPFFPDPHAYVVDAIAASIDRYINRFNLFNLLDRIG